MNFEIRAMQEDDDTEVNHLCNQLGYNLTNEQLRSNINLISSREDYDAFVAVHGNKIVGWISVACVISISSLPVCEVRGLVVDEKYRKNNIGKMLIEKCRLWGKEKNCSKLRLRCNAKRKEAQNFYIHLGFSEKKEQKVFEIDI